jgi:hypothetical protein
MRNRKEPMDYHFTATASGNVVALDSDGARAKAEDVIIDMIRNGTIRIKLEPIPE